MDAARDTRPPTELSAAIELRVQQLLDCASPLCARQGARKPQPRLRFDLRGRTAGQAIWHSCGTSELRFNLEIAVNNRDHFLQHTVAHEVAHLVAKACHGPVRAHGSEWRAIMDHFGIRNAQRCHNYELDEERLRHQRRWDYQCACARHGLSTTRHYRILRGQRQYHCRLCGTALRPVTAQD